MPQTPESVAPDPSAGTAPQKQGRPFRVKFRGSVLTLMRLPNRREVRGKLHQLSTTGGLMHVEKPLDEKLEVELIFHLGKPPSAKKQRSCFPCGRPRAGSSLSASSNCPRPAKTLCRQVCCHSSSRIHLPQSRQIDNEHAESAAPAASRAKAKAVLTDGLRSRNAISPHLPVTLASYLASRITPNVPFMLLLGPAVKKSSFFPPLFCDPPPNSIPQS